MQILLLDPIADRLEEWRSRLQSPEVSISTASSSADAIASLSQSRCTVVICDFRGLSCTWSNDIDRDVESLRSLSQCVFCVVNSSDVELLAQTFRAGFDDYLFDECSDEEFGAKIRRAEEIEQLNQRLAQAQKLESIGELAAGIAHEINTPIQYVGDNTRFVQTACDDLNEVLECCQRLVGTDTASTDLVGAIKELHKLMDDADIEYLREEIPSAIHQTLEGVDRVANIVRAMKEFAHPGVSEMTLSDLSKSIENTVMVARNEWKYVADLETVFDPNLPPVPCLPGELNQVLLNMIVNASHAIADSLGDSPDEKGKITISTQLSNAHAEIRISDTGSGISQENIDRIFTPFFTTKAAGKGTGQGLAIAHSVIVEKHNGSIHVESTVGTGTTFVIRIPLESRTQDETIPEEALANM